MKSRDNNDMTGGGASVHYDVSAPLEKDRLVVSPEQNFKGMSYGDWAAAWSNWLFSEDTDRNEAKGSMLFLRGNIEHYGQIITNSTIVSSNATSPVSNGTSFYNRTGDQCVVIPRG